MNQERKWYLGEMPNAPCSETGNFRLYIGDKLQNAVAFIGYRDSSQPGGICCHATGFLLSMGRVGYLVTARHVAKGLKRGPFAIRLNSAVGKKESYIIDSDNVEWAYHTDPNVDLAAVVFEGVAAKSSPYLNEDMLLTEARRIEMDVNAGCICYSVGLFKLFAGDTRNLPLVHAGHIASIQLDEPIQVYDPATDKTTPSRVFVVECHGLDGLSGAPVFVRQTRRIDYTDQKTGEERSIIAPQDKIDILGLYMGAWFLPPDDPLRKAYNARAGDTVPVGFGLVVPAERVVELMENAMLKKPREERAKSTAAIKTSAAPLSNDENPKHQEDFTSLLKAASKTPPQDG